MQENLPVVESFHSVQGEGAHVGKSAFFIRLASCKVGCPWCDTKDSWSVNHPIKNVEELSKHVVSAHEAGASFVVITGGEPLHHDLNPLCNSIRKATLEKKQKALPIHIETSGVNELSGEPNWITLSPKPHLPPRSDVLTACHELKVVINKKEDLFFAEEMAKKALSTVQGSCELGTSKSNQIIAPLLFLQPGWENRLGMNLSIEYVKHHPQWRLSIQTHKWLGVQ